jgi:hypothetical protein
VSEISKVRILTLFFLIILKTTFALPVYAAASVTAGLSEYFMQNRPYAGGSLFSYPAPGSTVGSNDIINYVFPGDSNVHYYVLGCSRPSGLTLLWNDEIMDYWPPEQRTNFGIYICTWARVPSYCLIFCDDTDFPDVLDYGIYHLIKIDSITTSCKDPDYGAKLCYAGYGCYSWIVGPDNYYYYVYKEQPPCGISSISISSPSVVPQKTSADTTDANVVVTLTNPAPSGGCTGRLRVEPVEFSGGHNHDETRKDHTGSLDSTVFTISTGESTTSAIYSSGEVAGQEKIIAEMLDSNGSISSEKDTTIYVKVDGLSPLISTSNVLSCGGTNMHLAGNNNYGTSDTLNAVYAAVGNYANKYHALYLAPAISLGVIDMSLPDGGLFDVYGDWQPPHNLHREGKSVDFSHYYMDICKNPVVPLDVIFYNKDGSIFETTNVIDDDMLDKMFDKQDCDRKEKNLGLIHYECTK